MNWPQMFAFQISNQSLLFRHLWDNQPYCRDTAKEELVVVLRRDREMRNGFFQGGVGDGHGS